MCEGNTGGPAWKLREKLGTHSPYGVEGKQSILIGTGSLEVWIWGSWKAGSLERRKGALLMEEINFCESDGKRQI